MSGDRGAVAIAVPNPSTSGDVQRTDTGPRTPMAGAKPPLLSRFPLTSGNGSCGTAGTNVPRMLRPHRGRVGSDVAGTPIATAGEDDGQQGFPLRGVCA